METILHLLPLTAEQQRAFRSAAPEAEHLFLPTHDRRGATTSPRTGGSGLPFCWASCRPRISGPFQT